MLVATIREIGRSGLAIVLTLAAVSTAGGQERVKPDPAAVARAKKALERAAAAEKDEAARDAALADLRAAPKIARFEALARALESSSGKRVRILAAREMAEMRERAAAPVIVQAIVREADRPARIEMTRALRAVDAPDTAVFFTRNLIDSDPKRRIRAMQGLSVFRDRRAVEALVQFVEVTASGFGKAAIEVTVDRAYVKDWQLVSGGTGLTVVEVPDPEIDIVRTGVAMDVQVRRVEMRFAVGLLQDLTGAGIGADAGAWRAWLADHKDFALAAPREGEK
jgi:hypothetical protein